ncbi:60S ribosomal protein L24 [Diplonema papillatum]|nr:60S ribosomal protein L24 [Diplonema papillatum]KAJ9455908.1 60S ribosomal protein L24 [Diplonema papillatum]
MKKETCSFSGLPIHPGHGKRYVPTMVVSTKPVLPFVTAKARALFLKKKNPRKVGWTVSYRRTMKKGTQEEMQKRRARRSKKSINRGYSAMDYDALQKKKSTKPADRSAAKAAALSELKERKAKAKKK